MARRKKRDKLVTLLVVLVLILGCILLLGKYLDEKSSNIKPDNSKNNNVEKKDNDSNKKENDNNNKEEDNTKKDNTEYDNLKSNENEEIETKNEVSRRGGNISIELIGDEEITIKKGSNYKDKGFKATYSDGSDASSQVEVENTVDTNNEGTYTVTYYFGNSVVIRRVTVE